jgi:hypothetical protein
MPAIVRRPWVIVCATIVLALVFSFYSQQLLQVAGFAPGLKEPAPAVHALLRISRQPQRLLEDTPHQRLDPVEVEQYFRTQVALVRSHVVLRNALENEKIRKLAVIAGRKDPIAWLQKQVRAEMLEDTEILRVSVRAGTPEEQAVLTNAIVNAYMSVIVKNEYAREVVLLNDIEKIYRESSAKLRAQRESYSNLADTLKTGDPQVLTIKKQLVLQELKALQGERLKVQSELRKLRLERAALDDKTESGPKAASQRDARSQLDRRIDLLTKLVKELDEELEARTRDADRPSVRSIELEFKQIEISQAEEVLRQLRIRKDRLEVELQSTGRGRVVVIALADAPG